MLYIICSCVCVCVCVCVLCVCVCSHVNTDPFKSNPLIVGYCGLLAYLLWKEEMVQVEAANHSGEERGR